MARGPAAFLLRTCGSKSNVSRIRVLLTNGCFHSLRQSWSWVLEKCLLSPAFDVPNRQFSTSLIDLVHIQLPTKNLKFKDFRSIGTRHFSSFSQDGDDYSGISSINNSKMDELENDSGVNFVESVASEDDVLNESSTDDSINIELEHSNEDVGVKKIEGYEHVAMRATVELYRELRNAEKNAKLKEPERKILQEVFNFFSKSNWAANQALSEYVAMSLFPTAFHEFRCFFFKKFSADVAMYLIRLGPSDAAVKFLHPIFIEFCRDEFADEISQFKCVIESDNGNDGVDSDKIVGYENVRMRDPVELYRELFDAEMGTRKTHSDWEMLQKIFHRFARSGWAANQALAIYIGMSFFPTAVQKFKSFFFNKSSANVTKYLVSLGSSDAAVKFLFPIFVEFCIEQFPDEIKRFGSMIESADLTKPHTWFPFARAMKRKIIYHCGPTNSGKTYNALQRFMEAQKGIYCSPLRLLAMEVFDKVNGLGVYCSLLTGQEKKYVPFSNHIACTVEMVSTDELYDVAVIDEIQMLSDPYRGYAWTRALLGLKADEIHLCGDPSVLNIVRKICSDTGDELYEHHYERFKPLVAEAKTLLGDLRNVRSGDCVVAFSRTEIFEVKLVIEKHTKHRCCVIYGALPPETRRQQANLFNDQDNEFDVLVASDAVGMGLNLNIRRVIFYSLSKYNGDKIVPVPGSQVKQISGRAGRRGSRYPDGLTTTLHLDDLDYLIECLKQPFDEVKKVGLFPFFEQVELFAGQLPNVTFCQLLEKFGESCRLDGSYFLCRHDHIKKVANMLEKVHGLSLEDRFNFCFAPVNIRDPKAMYHLLRFASAFGQNVPVNIAMGMPKGSARNDAELLDLETKHQVLSMYLWLSQHFKEETFPYVKKAEAMATDIAELLGQSLTKACWKPESRQAGKPKPQQKEDGYKRPRLLIKSFKKKRQESALPQESSEKVAVF